MPNVDANGIRIEHETFGDARNPTVLLINGLGSQMIRWDEAFCRQLVERGLHVIRFDNRDVGLSTKFEEAGVPNIAEAMAALQRGEGIHPPYTLEDMADDAVGLMDALGVRKAHVCGVSMGGMIAQIIAVRHPSRVASLVSMLSSTGNPKLPQAKPEAMAVLTAPPPADRNGYIRHSVTVYRTIGNPGFPFDEDRTRSRAALEYDRAFYPQGQARQLLAVLANGNRKPALGSVSVPTLVIHGADDPLVPVEAGIDTADAVPGAELLIIEGLGHDVLCPEVWPRWADAIAGHVRKAESLGFGDQRA